jgi:hypothetical protein
MYRLAKMSEDVHLNLQKIILGSADSDDDNVDEDGLPIAVEGPSKIGKKKAEKMQAKAEKKLEREAMQKELEEKKKQREKEDEEARYCNRQQFLSYWSYICSALFIQCTV